MKIYFRIPFTWYWVGSSKQGEKTLLCLWTKDFDVQREYFWKAIL